MLMTPFPRAYQQIRLVGLHQHVAELLAAYRKQWPEQ